MARYLPAEGDDPLPAFEPAHDADDRPGFWPFLIAALLFSAVWLLPIVFGYFAVADPTATYRSSPAEDRRAWDDHKPEDAEFIATLIRALGLFVGGVGVVGLGMSLAGVRRGRGWIIAGVAFATATLLLIVGLLRAQGFWPGIPLGPAAAVWVAALVSALVGFASARRHRRAARRERGGLAG